MTKTLTKQWREGTLKSGNYYTVCYKGWSGETFPCNLYYSERIGFDANVKEVLAPVPSYDEWKELDDELKELATKNDTLAMENGRLQEKLAIATKALKEYSVSDNWFMEDSEGKCWSFNKQYPWRIGFKALKEMEGVK